MFLSPLDWALIETWQEREVPLHIVLRGIEKVFDSYDAKPKKTRTVKSLMYCREEVEAQYEEWRESQIGKNTDEPTEPNQDNSMFSDETIVQHLQNISSELQSVKLKANKDLTETIERILVRLDELKTNFSTPEKLEEDLTHLEKLLDDCLLEKSDNLANLKAETEKELQSYKKTMTDEVYQTTFDLLLLKKLRLDVGIPRLSLFYL